MAEQARRNHEVTSVMRDVVSGATASVMPTATATAAGAAEEAGVGRDAHGEEEEDERHQGDALEDVGAALGE